MALADLRLRLGLIGSQQQGREQRQRQSRQANQATRGANLRPPPRAHTPRDLAHEGGRKRGGEARCSH